jgi:hypothetical protein
MVDGGIDSIITVEGGIHAVIIVDNTIVMGDGSESAIVMVD